MHSFGHTATYQAERKKNYWMKRKTVSKCNMQNRCRTTTTELNSWNEKGKGITADTEAKLQREKKTSKKVENKNTFSQCERCMCRERLFNGKCNWFFLPPPSLSLSILLSPSPSLSLPVFCLYILYSLLLRPPRPVPSQCYSRRLASFSSWAFRLSSSLTSFPNHFHLVFSVSPHTSNHMK